MESIRLRLICALMLLFAASPLFVHAEGEDGAPQLVETVSEESTIPAMEEPTNQTAAVPAATTRRTFVPVITTPTTVTIQFSSATSSACQPFTPGASFSNIKYLCYRIIIGGGKGQTFRTEWYLNGKPQAGLNRSGTVIYNSELRSGAVCYGRAGSCGDPLPRGAWELRVFLNNQLYKQATFSIS